MEIFPVWSSIQSVSNFLANFISFIVGFTNKLKEKNHIRVNNKDKKLPCDNADTKKTFVNSGTNITGRVNFLTGKGKRKKYLGVVVKWKLETLDLL